MRCYDFRKHILDLILRELPVDSLDEIMDHAGMCGKCADAVKRTRERLGIKASDKLRRIRTRFGRLDEIRRYAKDSRFSRKSKISGGSEDNSGIDSAVEKIANAIIVQSVIENAVKIKIEPMPGCGRVKYQVGSQVKEMMSLPVSIRERVVSRIKFLAGIEPGVHRGSGVARIVYADRVIDLRVISCKTSRGERISARLAYNDR